jgi:hypothetical protein
MTQNVTKDFVEISTRYFNLSFIILKNPRDKNPWTYFYKRIQWNTDLPTPKSFFSLDLGHYGRHTFSPCAPFKQEKDDCNYWLHWTIVRPEKEEDDIMMLEFRDDPKVTLAKQDLKTGISEHLDCKSWAEQLHNLYPALGTCNRLETVCRSQISTSLRNFTGSIASIIRRELSDPPANKRRPRSRSPDMRRRRHSPETPKQARRSKSPPRQSDSNAPQYVSQLGVTQPQPSTQQYQGQLQQPVPQTAFTQPPQTQYIPAQQLNPQQIHWNNSMMGVLANQPQPGLMYAPQRMSNT